MCGFVIAQTKKSNQLPDTEAMVQNLTHRGPDEQGSWRNESHNLSYSQCRLSIIDIEGGHQPMERAGYTVVYNGEIYNYQNLRDELRSAGFNFETDSDTEVLLQGYRHWDTEIFDRVRGMFSLAIWDPKKERTILARDHVGQKPLFYYQGANKFYAASEIQGLLSQTDLARSADYASISWYLSLGYIPAPRTGFIKLKKVQPGHYMIVEDAQIRDQVRYWDPTDITTDEIQTDTIEEQIRETVSESVRRRLVSDVPLGAFLSGGVDSSIIVGAMSEFMNQKPKTVSVGFSDDAYDERDFARLVAQYHDTDHYEYTVDIDIKDILPELVRHLGEPFADSSAIPTYYLAHQTRTEVKVALSGDGGDELFGGYRRYRAMQILNQIQRWIPNPLLGLVQTFAQAMGHPSERRSNWGERLRVLQMIAEPEAIRYLGMAGIGADDLKTKLAKGPLQRPAERGGEEWLSRWFRRFDHIEDPAQQSMLVDLMSYLPGDLLVKTDITTMMNSLECRSPFLDRDVLELGMNIPANRKLTGSDSKICLKNAFSDLLPDDVMNRSKMGFGVPLAKWFRDGDESEYLKKILFAKSQSFESIIDRMQLEILHEKHVDGEVDVAPFLWSLVMLKLWIDEYDVRI